MHLTLTFMQKRFMLRHNRHEDTAILHIGGQALHPSYNYNCNVIAKQQSSHIITFVCLT